MSATEVARLFHARREGKKWRAKCPVHRSNGLTLAIYADTDSVGVYCFAGCHRNEILASVGLTWKDTLYRDRSLSPAEKREWAKRKRITEIYHAEQRSQALKLWKASLDCKWKPIRTKSTFDVLVERAMERIEGMLPNV